MEVIDNLKTQADAQMPCWIFIIAMYSLNGRKANTEENRLNLVILTTTD